METGTKKTIVQIFGENLRRIRESRGVSRQELSVATGIAANMIGEYETARKLPPLDKIFTLADSLDVSITDLTGENKKSIDKKVFEYRFRRALDMADDAGYIPTQYADGTILIGTPIEVEADKTTGVVSVKQDVDSLKFKNAQDFVEVIEKATSNAISSNVLFNKAFRRIIFKEK